MRPKVSVFMLAYNQEEYIKQAIEGVLMQETDFPIELVIGEDMSTDRTREVCEKYASKYPHIIKLLLNKENLGIGRNYVRTLEKCTGKYIAICDGDDFWTTPLKLQIQVDFLESNLDFDIVFTNNRNIYPSGKREVRMSEGIPEVATFDNLIQGNFIASVTVMFRNKILPDSMKNWMKNLPFGDWPTYLWIIKDGGKIKFLKDITAVYRKNFGTSFHLRQSKSEMGELHVTILENLSSEKEFQSLKTKIEDNLYKHKTGLMASYIKDNKYVDSIKILRELLKSGGLFSVFKVFIYSFKRKFINA